MPKYFDRAEHHLTVSWSSRMCCALQASLLWPHNQRPRLRAIVNCMIQREGHGRLNDCVEDLSLI